MRNGKHNEPGTLTMQESRVNPVKPNISPMELSLACTLYIHYNPLMMQQKEACRKHPWVLPACFLEKLAKKCEFLLNLALKQ